MDQKDLGLKRYDAGKDYLAAIRVLNLEPDALFWAFDKSVEQLVLVLVTSLFDFAGPLALTELLFKAYNAAATPRDIDPFIIRLHSPNHALYRAAQIYLTTRVDHGDLKGEAFDRASVAGEVEPFAVASLKVGDLESFAAWVYKSTPTTQAKRRDPERRWARFERAVDAVAA